MSHMQDFASRLARYIPVNENFDVLCAWRVSFSEASRIAANGMPDVTINLKDVFELTRPLSFPEAFLLAALRHEPGTAEVVIRAAPDQAAYDVMLVRRRT